MNYFILAGLTFTLWVITVVALSKAEKPKHKMILLIFSFFFLVINAVLVGFVVNDYF